MSKKTSNEKSKFSISKTPKVDYKNVKDINDAYLLLNKTDMVINDNFYIMLNHVIKNFDKNEQSKIRILLYQYLDRMLEAMLPLSPLHRSLSSFYELIFYPLFVKNYRTPHKLSHFNINVDFIRNVLLSNISELNNINSDESGDDRCVKLVFFKFTSDLKLHEFITTKSGNVRQVYDKYYNIKSILMADNSELKIPKFKLENKSGNKRISGKSKSNCNI